MINRITISTFLALLIFGTPLATNATGFEIKRLHLYFDNNRAETVTKKNSPVLRAYVDLAIEGSGLLQGFWEVDGRMLANVNRHITATKETVTIATPEQPGLPTHESGTHRLRFVVTSPAMATVLPEVIYFVSETEVQKAQIKLLSPRNRETVPYQANTFLWQKEEGASTYLITFYSAEKKPVFSAYTRDHDYQLSKATLESFFKIGQEYTWIVISYGADQNRLGKSKAFRFYVKKPVERK